MNLLTLKTKFGLHNVIMMLKMKKDKIKKQNTLRLQKHSDLEKNTV